jgi:phosphomannomutase
MMDKEWIHLRSSNTEPVIRIYAEGKSRESADRLVEKAMSPLKQVNT